MNKQRKGFTTVELVIVIAVIAILATVLIPTFAGLIKKAQHSNDVQMAKNLTTQIKMYLVNNEIRTESDLRDAINENMGAGFYEGTDETPGLVPESAQYGYHFWYDIVNQEVVVGTVEEIDAIVEERSRIAFTDGKALLDGEPVVPTVSESWTKHFRHYKNFLLMDRGGSDIADAFAKLDVLNGGTNKYVDVLNVLTEAATNEGTDKAFAEVALAAFQKTAIVAQGTYINNVEGVVIENVYVSLRVTTLTATNTQINNVADLEFHMPSNVTKMDSYCLDFANAVTLNINTTEEGLKALLGSDAVSANCTINLPGTPGYMIDVDHLVGGPNDIEVPLNFSESNVVSDIALAGSAITQNKITLVPNQDGSYNLYVAADYTNTVTMSVSDFFNAEGLNIVARGTRWSASGNVECTDIKAGTFTISGYEDNRTAFAGTITAKIQNVVKTINVYGVKALGISIDLSNNQGLNIRDEDQNNVTITLPYTPGSENNKWSFVPSLTLNYTDTGIVLDGSLKVSDSKNVMGYAGGFLTLNSTFDNNTNTAMNVAYGKEDEEPIATSDITYTLRLINAANKSFSVDSKVTTQTYTKLLKYYIGNVGAFKIDYLFDVLAGKDVTGQIILVKISQGGTPIVTYNYSNLNGQFNPGVLETLNADYVIEIGLGEKVRNNNNTPEDPSDDYDVYNLVTATTPVTVHLVAGNNITTDTAQADIPSGSDKNIVLLSDINLSASKTLNNVYGNLHKINATTPNSSGENYWAAHITLKGTMRDTLVLGPVYSSVGFTNSTSGWDGVQLNGTAHIMNSYVFGFRAPVSLNSASDVKISNSTIEGGTYANLHVANSKITLTNVALIQDKNGYTATDNSSTKVYGMGIFCDTASYAEIVLEGTTKQYNWISANDADSINTSTGLEDILSASVTDIVGEMLSNGAGFTHTAVDASGNTIVDGSGNAIQYINLGIIQELEISNAGCDNETIAHVITVTDRRTTATLTKGNRINYKIMNIYPKYYDGYSYLPTGNGKIGPTDFLPEGWTSKTIKNYENFLNDQK